MRKSILLVVLIMASLLVGCDESPTKSLNTDPESFNTAAKETEEKDQEDLVSEEDKQITNENKEAENINIEADQVKTIATNKEEMSIEEIILKYKEILKISPDFDEVSTEESSETDGNKYYTVNYYDSKTDESMWFSADIYGNLMNFSAFTKDTDNKSEGLTSTEAMDLVRETLNDLYGPVSEDFIISKNADINTLGSTSYYFNVIRTVNKIKVPTDTILFEVSKGQKKITSLNVYTASNYDFSDTSNFEDLDGIVDEITAFDAFMKENKIYPLQLKILNRDNFHLYEKYNLQPALGFIEKQIPVNAKDLSPYYLDPFRLVGYGGEKAEEAAQVAEGALSPAEQEQLDTVKDQYSLEDAEKKARSLFSLKDYKLSYSNFSTYRGTKGYNKWSLSFNKDDSYVYVSLLANDLSLVSYSNYEEGNKAEADAENYLNLANDFLVSKAGLDLSKLTLTKRSSQKQGDNYHIVEYHRNLDDGQILYSDTVTVNINKKSGKVEYFDKAWTYDLKDQVQAGTINEAEAYKKLKDSFGFDLVYLRDTQADDKILKAYYSFDSSKLDYTGIFLVDGKTGQVINLEGKEFLTGDLVEYEDIDSAKHPEIIKTLLENNIGFPGGELLPTKAVTQEEVFRILLAGDIYGDFSSASTDDIYKLAKDRGLLKDEERKEEKIIRNRDYARYLARYLSYDEIGLHNEIFKDTYKDISSTDSDYGYLVLAKLKKLMDFPSDNLLEADKEVDRESLLYYYYYLKANN
ncbi:hypothetical protein [Neofamilia massiliensis]|uniref:hypothetical protein n=1 Tax=Neofamilia massiliensis TaxID=1673724 RepID=UPI0006BB686F|nr:hypothetical protein [Neofamilia massiliensis]